MAREIDLASYLPDVMKEVVELREISRTEDPELVKLWDAVRDVLADQFVEDSTENGVKRWENILKIIPKGTNQLNERKFRILTRLNEQLPYSIRMLAQQLETLCGSDGYSVEVKNKEYTLTVKVALAAKSNFGDVDSLLHRIVPANMIIDLDLKYNQHRTLAKFTHRQLAKYSQQQLRDEVLRGSNLV